MAPNIRKIESNTEIDRMLNDNFISEVRTGFVEVGKDNFCVPIYYQDFEERINKFEVRDEDVFIVAHPKTGTTWTQEMVWLLMNNLDYEGAREDIIKRFPTLETAVHMDSELVGTTNFYGGDFMQFLDELPSPRCIKTHLHWSMLPEQIKNGTKKPKIISVLRNAQDTCVSFYHHCRLIEGYKGNFDEFCELFLAGRSCYGPFWKSVLSVWAERHRSNTFFIKFSDMKKNLASVIRNVAKFLEKDINEEQLEELVKHLSFDSMKKNPAVNLQKVVDRMEVVNANSSTDGAFIRRGLVGGYKSEMNEKQIKDFEEWTKENTEGTDLSFD